MYVDIDTFVLVLSDPTSDNSVHHMLESFFAKIFKPLKVSWIRLFFSVFVATFYLITIPVQRLLYQCSISTS